MCNTQEIVSPENTTAEIISNNCHRAVENQPQRGGSNPASLRCLFDRVFEVEGQESVGG